MASHSLNARPGDTVVPLTPSIRPVRPTSRPPPCCMLRNGVVTSLRPPPSYCNVEPSVDVQLFLVLMLERRMRRK